MSRRRRFSLLALLLLLALLPAAAASATSLPATAAVHALPVTRGPNYAVQPGQRLPQLTSSFVASQLGLPPAGDLARLLTTTRPGSVGAGGVQSASTLVRSPSYACVNGHQTADPLSPPCVTSFSGDNGGATYPGVTGDEIRLLVLIAPAQEFNVTRRAPWGSYYDLAAPPTSDETGSLQTLSRLRLYQRYFNARYFTYGRRVHFFVYSMNQLGALKAGCVNVAKENYALIHPFAVLIAGYSEEVPPCYGEQMARERVPTFYGDRQLETQTLRVNAPYIWALRPETSEAARIFSSYICQKVVHRPVVMSGPDAMNGQVTQNGEPRQLGLLVPANLPEYGRLAAAVKRAVTACGGSVADTETFEEPYGTCSTFSGSVSEAPQGYPIDDINRAVTGFEHAHVTTVIWPGCADPRVPAGAATAKYYPEWVLWGAGELDLAFDTSASEFYNPVVDDWAKYAVLVTSAPFHAELHKRLCFGAMREADSAVAPDDETWIACEYYDRLRQVFSAIQLAGPQLTPAAMDVGVRAGTHPPSSPQVPLCYYPAGEYSCIKDAQVNWWDATAGSQPAAGVGPTGQRIGGCWRAMESGRRYEAWKWPAGNIDAQLHTGDPCSYQGSYAVP